MKKNDEYYMKLALREAQKAYSKAEVPIGAVIVRDEKVIARAHNLKEKLQDPTAHAEILAIKEACSNLGSWRLTDSTLYVTIEPCPMCAGALVQARVEQLVFGAADPKAGAVGSLLNLVDFADFNHQLEFKSGVLEQECRQVIKSFFADLRDK
ncbi:tRNA adenosine(34) deaminase TadA [Fuchsiella alkaliacetigena]|uniref:tRNA adenosine(34) deaminase TadA n=1 Tax=Fuchsiella alkaliacetigena TaxID=957042 RepID=UPI00200A4112|nr:tRNA adenosine(34) deaminase TadA [Fuchsiella alkaliacetigena]